MRKATYHPTVDRIRQLLDEHSCWYETFEHADVRTSEEAAAIRDGYTLGQGAKALIVRAKLSGAKQFAMVVLPGDRRFDASALKIKFGMRDVRFATESEVADLTNGIKPGGVPPFGNLFGLPVYADAAIFDNERIVFNAGDGGFSIGMNAKDYQALVQPQIAEIS